MRKYLCIGDSLALPGHLNKYEDTWFYQLKICFPDSDFISFFKRQLTSSVLTTQGGGATGVDRWPRGADCLEAYMPDTVIIQLGIVDCAPRLLNTIDRKFLSYIPEWAKSPYVAFIKMIRKRNPNRVLVPFEEFKQYWTDYTERAKKINAEIIIISISIPDERMSERNRNIIKNIMLYNSFYRELEENYSFVKVTEPLRKEETRRNVYEDGYHPNKLGQKIIYERIKEFLR